MSVADDGDHLLADRHLDVVLLGEGEDRLARLDPLGRRAQLGGGLRDGQAAPEPDTEAVVARERGHARRDEVADAGEPHERLRVGAERQTEARRLGQPARDDRGLRVVTETHALGHAGGQGHDVLRRTADLGTRDVGVGVGPEPRRRAGGRHPFGRRHVAARDDGGRRLPTGDLRGEVGPRHDHDAVLLDVPRLRDDLTHAHRRAELDPLHQGDDRHARGDRVAPLGQVVPQGLRGDGEHDDVGLLERLAGVHRGADRRRQLELRQVGVVAPGVDGVGDLPAAGPHGDVAAGVRQDHRERRAPVAPAQDRDPRHERFPSASFDRR